VVCLLACAANAQTLDRDKALRLSQAAIGRSVADDSFVDSTGKQRRLSEYRGKPVVISLIFTSCAYICPTTTQQLRRVVEEARAVLGQASFRVVTVGFDAHRDTPAAMAEFAHAQRVDTRNWDFLSADTQTIDKLSEQLGFQFYAAGGGFDHLIQTTILDANGVVYRQVYGADFKVQFVVEPLKDLVFGRANKAPGLDLTNRIRLFCTVYDPATGRYRFSYAIFVGLGFGVVMGSLFIYFMIKEWQSYFRSQRPR
jgi:protein SCO1/2